MFSNFSFWTFSDFPFSSNVEFWTFLVLDVLLVLDVFSFGRFQFWTFSNKMFGSRVTGGVFETVQNGKTSKTENVQNGKTSKTGKRLKQRFTTPAKIIVRHVKGYQNF